MAILVRSSAYQDQYVAELRAAYQGVRLYDPSFAQQDPDIWEKMLRNPTICHAVEKRLHAVAGRHWHLDPASDKDPDKRKAAVVEAILRRVREFNLSRYRLATAVFHGRSYGYIEGDRVLCALEQDAPPLSWWIPARIRDIDPRGVRFAPVKTAEGTVEVRTEIRSLAGDFWSPVTTENEAALIPVVYGDSESRLGYGRGLKEALYYAFYAVGRLIQEGLAGVERWAQGLIVAKVNAEAAGSTDATSRAAALQMRDTLEDMKSRHILVIDDRDDITVQFPSGTGHEMVMAFVNYWDDRILQLIQGSLRPSGEGDGGAYAQAKVEAESSESLIAFDRDILDEALTERLIGLVCRLNHANFVRLGLGEAGRPRFVTSDETQDDPSQAAQVIATALGAGVALKKSEVYERLGFTPPAVGDEVFEGTPGGTDPLSALLNRTGGTQ